MYVPELSDATPEITLIVPESTIGGRLRVVNELVLILITPALLNVPPGSPVTAIGVLDPPVMLIMPSARLLSLPVEIKSWPALTLITPELFSVRARREVLPAT